ncbi:hypothetical protein [Roseococcus suduntuyensis]|uniref:Uncharacterized protein n=1 Tax=Roseococcus suduntuyensis TaxID=455361 RepID=A0A840AC61_9PROT|nr:hypothetical protein [Roseococcus suduntuyensis]MBB3898677.1 hypothetical protein [Roseococcus suduntuyensis]
MTSTPLRLMAGAALVALSVAAAPARADDIRDAIAEAARTYAAGDLAGARAALGEAQQLLQQRAADGVAAALPDALPGWTAEDAETQAAGVSLFGGMTQASRRYRNAAGETVEIQIMADNPMLAQFAMILANPAMAGAMGRLIRVGPHRAVQGNDGQITMLLKNRYLVQVGGSAPAPARLAYAQAVDQARLPD